MLETAATSEAIDEITSDIEGKIMDDDKLERRSATLDAAHLHIPTYGAWDNTWPAHSMRSHP